MKLFIICGHGGNPYDPGAIGNGFKEAEQVRKLGKKIKELGGDQVILGDISQNWYDTGGISTYNFAKGTEILELHMDASDSTSAKGGHVIIDADFNPDAYDNKLASMISTMFPGRSTILSKRNLANTNRAQSKGVSYRLLECAFITNADDAKKFDMNIEALAKKILECFGIGVAIKTEVKEPVQETVVPEKYSIELTFDQTGKAGTFKVIQ